KVGQKLYALTREGRQTVRRLLRADETPLPEAAVQPIKLAREQERFLQGLLGSTALSKYREGHQRELTFADACRFWSITENLYGEALNGRLAEVRAALAELDRHLGMGRCVLTGGRHGHGRELRPPG